MSRSRRFVSYAVAGAVLAGALVAAGGCVSATGDLDGGKLKLTSGYFLEQDPSADASGEEYPGSFFVELASVSNFCGKMADFDDDFQLAEDGGDAEDAWADNIGAQLWRVQVMLVLEDTHESQRARSLDGIDWDETSVGEDEFYAMLIHYTEVPDADIWEGSAYLDEAADIFVTDGGSLKITKHTVDKTLGGRIEAPVVWYDADEDPGDDAGAVTITFEVGTCTELLY